MLVIYLFSWLHNLKSERRTAPGGRKVNQPNEGFRQGKGVTMPQSGSLAETGLGSGFYLRLFIINSPLLCRPTHPLVITMRSFHLTQENCLGLFASIICVDKWEGVAESWKREISYLIQTKMQRQPYVHEIWKDNQNRTNPECLNAKQRCVIQTMFSFK